MVDSGEANAGRGEANRANKVRGTKLILTGERLKDPMSVASMMPRHILSAFIGVVE